jgi:cytochrome c553
MNRIAVAASGLAVAALLAFAAGHGLADDAKPTYIGSSKCMKCHSKQVTSWKKTALAKSMETLKPVTEKDNKDLFEARKKANLDPAKDYSTDPKCLACHTTGYGKDGGYPEKITDDNKKVAEVMGSVSCEACHGPASVYYEYKNAKRKENKDYVFTKEELAKVGLSTPTAATCDACHNKDAPSQPATPFKFEDAKAKTHEHVK